MVGGGHAGAVAEFLEDGQCLLVEVVGGVVVAPGLGEDAQVVVPGCLLVLIEVSVLDLPIGQFPLVIPSSNTIEDARGCLGGVVGLLDIARFAEVSITLHQVVDIRLPALGRCPVVPHPVGGCAPMTRYLVLLGGLHRRLLLAFHGRSGPPVDEPLRRGTASALQAGEERCGDQLIQEVVNRQVGGERRIWGAIRLILGGVMFHGRAENKGGGGPLDRSAEEGESHEESFRLGAEKIQ